MRNVYLLVTVRSTPCVHVIGLPAVADQVADGALDLELQDDLDCATFVTLARNVAKRKRCRAAKEEEAATAVAARAKQHEARAEKGLVVQRDANNVNLSNWFVCLGVLSAIVVVFVIHGPWGLRADGVGASVIDKQTELGPFLNSAGAFNLACRRRKLVP